MREFGPQATCRNETLGAVTASTTGTTVPNGGAGAWSSWQSIGTSSFSYERLILRIVGAPGNITGLIEIGIGTSSATVWTLAQQLLLFQANPSLYDGVFDLPLHVPSGSQLWVRTYAGAGTSDVQVILHGSSVGIMGVPGFSRLLCLADLVTIAGGAGLAIATTTANVRARQQFVASSTDAISALALCMVPVTASRTFLVDVEVGAVGSEEVIASNLGFTSTVANGQAMCTRFFMIHRAFASGLRFSLNAQASAATSTFRAGLYGFQ